MERNHIKNIELCKALELANLIKYQEGQVVSTTLVQNNVVSITLFAIAKKEGISTHMAAGDALVYILDGVAEITIGEKMQKVEKGQVIVMPANIPHSLVAVDKFKMLLTVVK
ncbi:cupin domain-containing protein [Pectinatus frisingensis]|jgi:quercetin dioxygenase-like cupin family protein|uniref:cupin domain-containing protein n=1 Tax=Pectinatus frisingensis TaxID=865 RepID=UPI0015F7720B|nr:cupin domain-containing protein [Pectinatus frisingensis]